MKKLILVALAGVVPCLGAYELGRWRKMMVVSQTPSARAYLIGLEVADHNPKRLDVLAALDAHGLAGVQEISRGELVRLMGRFRSVSRDENANLDRGCLGLTCVYQALGLKRWPELARGTVAYLSCEDARKRRCPSDQENFIFLKQDWWLEGKPPIPDPGSGEVPLDSVTRLKPGGYTFNYAVYFPNTDTYAWINHRDYGFPANLIRPQKAYLSSSPPPLDAEARPAQVYCSTCR